jgi:hypothetical protein
MHIPAFNRWQLFGRDLIVSLGDRFEEFAHLAEKAKKTRGGYLSFDADLPKKIRSTGERSQNHHLNGHVGQLAAAAQISTATMKQYVKTMAALELGYPTEAIDGKAFPKSEAEATVEECILLIDMCHAIAAKNGWALYEGEGWQN